jgi:aminoglycoside phosphotransferase (APT) family kinase protein
MRTKPPPDIAIDQSLVRALLLEQHADLAHLRLIAIGEGWDNSMFRLGDALAVRLPRRAASAVLIENEQRWLPELSRRLPLPIPVPIRIGRPGCGFPWSWSVVPWFSGQNALHAQSPDLEAMAVDLSRFLRALHQPAPDGAPHNPWRGGSLASRATLVREHLQQLDGLVDRTAVLGLWDRALSTASWPGPPLWIHGDFHPGNFLVSGGRLAAVIDFGDLTAVILQQTSRSFGWCCRQRSGQASVHLPEDDSTRLTTTRGCAPAAGRSRWDSRTSPTVRTMRQ